MSSFESGVLPYFADDFLIYSESIKGRSPNTVHEYYYDLLLFFRFIKKRRKPELNAIPYENISVNDISLDMLKSIQLTDLYAFINYISNQRNDKAATRARKVASIRSFFKYATSKANILETNPAIELESPKLPKRLPRHLELDESKALLDAIEGPHKTRDYCIMTLFLNCGMRLSELVGINLSDIREDTLTVTGKGAKERTIYLNNACLKSLNDYIKVRPRITTIDGISPLFISSRKQRISPKTVEYTVKKYLQMAGLDPKKYSTHKLRHTAATLMYTHGDVDIRTLQEILGHESVATTEIYTHINNERLKDAIRKNPLADL